MAIPTKKPGQGPSKPQSGGWTMLPAWLTTDDRMLALTHRQFRLFVHMLCHAWRNAGDTRTRMLTGQVYRSAAQLAADLRIDRSSVYADIRHMISAGLLRRDGDALLVVEHEQWSPSPRRGIGGSRTAGSGEVRSPCAEGEERPAPEGGTATTPWVKPPQACGRIGQELNRAKSREPMLHEGSGPTRAVPSDVESSEEESPGRSDDDVSRACGTADCTSSSPLGESGFEEPTAATKGGGGIGTGSGAPSTGAPLPGDWAPGQAPGLPGGVAVPEPPPTASHPFPSPDPPSDTSEGEERSVRGFLGEHGLTPSQSETYGGLLTLAEAKALVSGIEHGCRSKPDSNPVAIVVSVLKQGRPGIEAALRRPGARTATRRVPIGSSKAVTEDEMREGIDRNRAIMEHREVGR